MRALHLVRTCILHYVRFLLPGASAAIFPSNETLVFKTVSVSRIIHLKVVGNIDLTILKGDHSKGEIGG